MTTAVPRYLSAGLSDQGYVRPNNEDRVYCDDVRGFFLVVDGMGGHEAGEQAAQIAVERIRLRLERQTDTVEQRLREAITLANNAICETAQENPDWKGMACVLTAAVVEDGQVIVGHVGDSRLYRVKRNLIEKMTHDHSPVGEREDSGQLSEAEAMQHPRRNEVYRDVGSEERTPDAQDFIEILRMPFEPDSALLLCSDGLSDAVPAQDILKIIEENAGDRWATVRALIAAANEVGKDNVSAVLVEGERFASSFDRRPVRRTDVSGVEKTDRAPVASADRPRPDQPRKFLYFVSGALLGCLVGAAFVFAAQRFWGLAFLPKPDAPVSSTPAAKILAVSPTGSIDDALAKAQPGDTISVAPGTYSEKVRLKSGVAVTAQRVHEAIIRGSIIADGIQDARLEGFSIREGDAGVRITDSDVVLSRDDIGEIRGTGLTFSGNSRGAVVACEIHNNAGAGILVEGGAAPAIENNVIRDNGTQAGALMPGLFVKSVLNPVIAANIFSGNGAEPIWLSAADEGLVEHNYFLRAGNADRAPKIRIISDEQSGQEGRP